MSVWIPASLRITVLLLMLGFAAILSAVNLWYHVPRAERLAQDNSSRQFVQDMSRLQSTLEYLLLKGELIIAQHNVSVLAHNHDYRLVLLIDDQQKIIASTQRALLGQLVTSSVPDYDPERAAEAIRVRRAQTLLNPGGDRLFGYVGVLMGRRGGELKPSRSGTLFLSYDLSRAESEARAQVLNQSLYWVGWVTALALAIWLVLHYLLTRRAALLVSAAERLASGDLEARSALRGRDELGRLSRSFDAMAAQISRTQTQLKKDIEERARMLQALENSEIQYRSMFNASIDGLMLWSADGTLVDVNPALWQMYGYTREDFVALAPAKFIGPDSGVELLQPVNNGQALHIDISDTRKDGSALELEVHTISMQYQGKPHVLAIARDVTEKKQAAERLTQQRDALHQREKLAALGSLLAGVSHELNNPLSVVVGRSVMLEEQANPANRASVSKIRAAAERCARIVRTFLAMARQQQPERSATSVNEIISAALDIIGYSVRTSGVEVTLKLADEVPDILADGDQLHQVLLNLIVNAQQALQKHPPPRCIVISSYYEHSEELIRITVADNGPGIPADIIGRIFEPYFTTKPVGTGLGAGLAVSLGIIEAHNGTLTVECPENPGGTIFTVKLPATSPESQQHDADLEAEEYKRPLSILVIDDEESIRETLAEILESEAHQVTLAASGCDALQRIKASPFDVILSDIRMPDMDGLTLYEEIQQRWPEQSARVIFVTGDTLTASLAEWANQRGCPVIEKPFLPSEVRRFVAERAAAVG